MARLFVRSLGDNELSDDDGQSVIVCFSVDQ